MMLNTGLFILGFVVYGVSVLNTGYFLNTGLIRVIWFQIQVYRLIDYAVKYRFIILNTGFSVLNTGLISFVLGLRISCLLVD